MLLAYNRILGDFRLDMNNAEYAFGSFTRSRA